MSAAANQITITLTRDELEALLHQVVREELRRLLVARHSTVLDDWSQEGDDDLDADAALLTDVLELIERDNQNAQNRISWQAAKAELARAEASGELSR